MQILISAGEASGEMYGAQLIEALRRSVGRTLSTIDGESKSPSSRTERGKDGSPSLAAPSVDLSSSSIEFFGVGGDKMRAAGCDVVVDAKDLAVVGITEILRHLPKIWGLFRKLIAEADKRVRLLRKYVDKALVIFPFEEKFYRDRGVDAEFVGHPLADLPRPAIIREQYGAEHGLDPAKPWITLMPGSRIKEVRMNLPEMLKAASLLGEKYEFVLPVAPTLEGSFIQGLVNPHVSKTAKPGAPSDGIAQNNATQPIHFVPDSLPALAHSRAGVIASGTATVEAAIMETPFVMVYRVTPLTYLLGRSTVKVPHFAMVNLIADREVVPELVQSDFTAERVASEIDRIGADGEDRETMLSGLREVRGRLRGVRADAGHPADRAARTIFLLTEARQMQA